MQNLGYNLDGPSLRERTKSKKTFEVFFLPKTEFQNEVICLFSRSKLFFLNVEFLKEENL